MTANRKTDGLSFTVNIFDRLADVFEVDNVTQFDECFDVGNSIDGPTVLFINSEIVNL